LKVLIIGSKGFIGSHCLSFFSNLSNSIVYGCDVIVDYNNENYFLVDATNANFHQVFETTHFDLCINCSGAASVANSIKDPYRDFTLNTKNVLVILDAIRKYRPNCKFINLSSAAVYGNPTSLPIKELTGINPISPYGIHKLQAEQICSYYHKFYNIPTCSLRIFSAYGNGLKKQLFWDLAHKQAVDNTITLYGTGNESRDFIHVADIISIISLIVNKGNFEGEAVNIANGQEVFIKDVAKIFFGLLNPQIKFKFSGESRKGDPINWVADISKIQTLGYSQKIALEQGLEQYIQWVKKLS